VRKLIGLAVLCLAVGCSTPKVTFQADGSFSHRAANQAQEELPEVGAYEDLIDLYLTLPAPPPISIPNPPIVIPPPPTPPPPPPPAPPPPPNPYAPLLSFLQAGPYGSNFTQAHLTQLSPYLLSLAQLYQSGTPLNQVLNSGPAWQLAYSAQQILQPLGLWNYQTLQQWLNYLQPRQQQLLTIATNLYNNVTSPPPPPPPPAPGQPPPPPQPIVIPQPPTIIFINPFQIFSEVSALWTSKNWLAVASRFPGLLFPLIESSNFTNPLIVLYGSRSRHYEPSAQTLRETDDGVEAHNLTHQGYYKNDYASGAGRFHQGKDDITLSYCPVEIKGNRVTTLDVVASDRFALLKRLSGGDVELLDRAFTHDTAALSIDAAFNNRHIRVVGGLTPYSSMGGLMGEVTYETEYLTGRIGGGAMVETSLHGNTDTLLGFLDTEHTLRTPYASVRSDDDSRIAWAWASLTFTGSAMAERALTHQSDKRDITGRWGFQGDVRLIPEIHTQLDNDYLSLHAYGGFTAAVVPVGKVDLDHPERSVLLDVVRSHIGMQLRVLVSDIIKAEKDEEFDHTMFVDVGVVGEFSELVRRWRVTTKFVYDLAEVGFVCETESYQQRLGLDDVKLGGRLGFMGAYFQALKSVKSADFRLQAGFKIEL
jgi:hypothetical protein